MYFFNKLETAENCSNKYVIVGSVLMQNDYVYVKWSKECRNGPSQGIGLDALETRRGDILRRVILHREGHS
jgi:hypothetical protein